MCRVSCLTVPRANRKAGHRGARAIARRPHARALKQHRLGRGDGLAVSRPSARATVLGHLTVKGRFQDSFINETAGFRYQTRLRF